MRTPEQAANMPEPLYKERINAPITFESTVPEEERPVSRGTGVVILPNKTTAGASNPVVWDQQRIHAATMLCRQQGFLPGCIVAKRQLPGAGVDWKVTSHFYWGLVTSHNCYIPGNRYDEYAPLNVRWFERANHGGQAEEQLFPGQLYLIHAALSEEVIRSKMTAQG